MEVFLQIIVEIAAFVKVVSEVIEVLSQAKELYNDGERFITILLQRSKKPPKSVGAEVDGSNNSLN